MQDGRSFFGGLGGLVEFVRYLGHIVWAGVLVEVFGGLPDGFYLFDGVVELLVLFGDSSVQEVSFDRRFGGADVEHDFHGCLQLGHDVLRSIGDEVLFVGEVHPKFGQVAGGVVSLEEGVALV